MGLVLIASFLSEGSQRKQIFKRNKNSSRCKSTKSSIDVWLLQRWKSASTSAKKARHDPSQERAGWVDGCSAALPRKDSFTVPGPRGHSISASPGIPGPSPRHYNRGRGSARGFQRGYPRAGSRGYPLRGRRGSYWCPYGHPSEYALLLCSITSNICRVY